MDTDKRPVLAGLIALVSVALVIGVLGGLGLMVAVKATGIGGSTDSSSGSSPSASFYLPKPTDTGSNVPEPEETQPGSETTQPPAPAEGITLSASQVSVSAMQQIDLNGTYPTGEGAILQVQRFEDGEWSDFPVTMSVSGSTFATYVLTSRIGPNKFRVIDTDTETTSNEVTVTVG